MVCRGIWRGWLAAAVRRHVRERARITLRHGEVREWGGLYGAPWGILLTGVPVIHSDGSQEWLEWER